MFLEESGVTQNHLANRVSDLELGQKRTQKVGISLFVSYSPWFQIRCCLTVRQQHDSDG